MPRPQRSPITFTIDGRDVVAPEGTMLADAAKVGDVEIPVFCYEPKLGAPVGACRMCLVEVEGIPKLQTACSTPVKDGMVVNTTAPKVKAAQESVLEFLLVNHPLDCPVCDKGGECPLQDISYGWGRGLSRVAEPKRHFTKPLELSPLIAIDRERCILCYRCVRFSQEVAEDHQLVFLERGADTYVGTFDSHPYVAPFSGNIIELCPVGALTSRPYRFRARPWDIEGGGTVCTLCPGQCNVTHTVRDERVLRTLSRENDAVDDGWLCDKGRFSYQAATAPERLQQPLVRDADGNLQPASWDDALDRAASILRASGERTAAIAGGRTLNEEGYLLQRLLRDQLSSPHLESRIAPGPSRELLAALHAPALQATVPDLEFAHHVLLLDIEPQEAAPILELRLRKGARRLGTKLSVAGPRPSALDPRAQHVLRYAPGGNEGFLKALAAALEGGDVSGPAAAAGIDAAAVSGLADTLKAAGEDRVILYSDALLSGPGADESARALLRIAAALSLSGEDGAGSGGAGLLGIPATTNGRGLREAGVLPDAGPGLRAVAHPGRDLPGIAEGLAGSELDALIALGVDPIADLQGRAAWRQALGASHLIAVSSFLTEGVAGYAAVVFPQEAPAEQEGTLTHPDGRVQRARPAVRRPDGIRSGWWVLAQLAARLGDRTTLHTAGMAFAELTAEVPFLAGLTLDEIGGKGVRWPTLAEAATWPKGTTDLEPQTDATVVPPANGALRLARQSSPWRIPEVAASKALRFLVPSADARLAPADAERLGITEGSPVALSVDGTEISATARLDSRIPAGTVVAQAGVPGGGADELGGAAAGGIGLVEVRSA
ncbi:MAG: NADH-quinone oxidoreductase subunit NuoG [Solirubrobacteraceae bacterium]|nr:NADH-quinone oxidoreductase subunit NuoG [Solirubrobacteraceae bacterium]